MVFMPPGAASSVWWFFAPDGEFEGWYVNLEDPCARWSGGVDTADHALDIRVEPDRSWRWKDEDEFAERVGHPLYWTAEQAAAIRAEGQRLADLAETGKFPFDGSWCDLRPDPGWPPLTRPDGWDGPRAAMVRP
jgi:predicted RNA-binding protein associated with RNAse of E/G family